MSVELDYMAMSAGSLMISVASFVAAFMFSKTREAQVRLQELSASTDFFKLHRETFAVFRDDPEAPQSLLDFLSDFSERLENHHEVVKLINSVLQKKALVTSDESNRLIATYEGLESPLKEIFEHTLTTGMLGATLRWPDTSKSFAALIVTFNALPKPAASQARQQPVKWWASLRFPSIGEPAAA